MNIDCVLNPQRLVKNKKVKILIHRRWRDGYIQQTDVWKIKKGVSKEHVLITYTVHDPDKKKNVLKNVMVERGSNKFKVVRNRTRSLSSSPAWNRK